MKLLSAVLCICVSSMAYAYPGWDDAVVLEKANTCANVLIKQGTPVDKARNQCACFLNAIFSTLTEKQFDTLKREKPYTFTKVIEVTWETCSPNLR
jgi:hypothetical protein